MAGARRAKSGMIRAMSKSLQEQLLSMGIANKKKAKKIQQEQRKKRKARGKKPPLPDALKAKIVRDAAAKARRDRELNLQRAAGEQAKAERSQIEQMIEAHRVSRDAGDVPYKFVMAGKVKQIYVSKEQHAALIAGKLRIAHCAGRFDLVQAEAADRIAARDAKAIIDFVPAESPDDAGYEGFEVPDDLMW